MLSTILLYILLATCPLNGGISGILVFKDFTKLLLHALFMKKVIKKRKKKSCKSDIK
jgi:hypothetical protein